MTEESPFVTKDHLVICVAAFHNQHVLHLDVVFLLHVLTHLLEAVFTHVPDIELGFHVVWVVRIIHSGHRVPVIDLFVGLREKVIEGVVLVTISESALWLDDLVALSEVIGFVGLTLALAWDEKFGMSLLCGGDTGVLGESLLLVELLHLVGLYDLFYHSSVFILEGCVETISFLISLGINFILGFVEAGKVKVAGSFSVYH